MNPISMSSYGKSPSFGMAFVKPNKEVLDHFVNVIEKLPPEGRKTFVSEVGKIVESAKDCPVPINHAMIGSYETKYAAVVDGKNVVGKSKYSGVANEIIATMMLAAEKARDKADALNNVKKIYTIFGV